MLMVNPNRHESEEDQPASGHSTWSPLPFFAGPFLISALALDVWVSVFLSNPFRPWLTLAAVAFFGIWYAVARLRRSR